MKKTISILYFLIFSLLFSNVAFAITPTPTPAPTTKPTDKPSIGDELEKKIQTDIINKVASKVAELKLTEPKGVIGTVQDISDSQITIENLKGDLQIIDVDEFTKFASPSAKDSFGISDIKKSITLGILGRYNKESKRILARFVNVQIIPTSLHGAVTAVNSNDFFFYVVDTSGQQTRVDVETVTKNLSISKSGTQAKAGFSKITPGMHIIVTGFKDKTNKNDIIASRILIFPDFPKDPRIPQVAPAIAPQDTVIPSTGSGKKLTPITQ